MKFNSLISVIIPTFNRAKLLGITIKSILEQTYQKLEVIIIDDGSTDNTEESVRKIEDVRIKYLNHGKIGDIAKLRNIGLSYSTGEYIAFCDDDDLWKKDKLQKQMIYLNRYDFVCSNADIIDDSGYLIYQKYFEDIDENYVFNIKHLLLTNPVLTSSVLLKKSILNYKFIERGLSYSAEDYEMWLKLSLSNNLYFLNDSLISFRKHNNTSTFVSGQKYIELTKQALLRVKEYESNPDNDIKYFSRIGIVKHKYQLCKTYLKCGFIILFLIEFAGITLRMLNFRILMYFVKSKTRFITQF